MRTKHFSKSEVACRCCDEVKWSPHLMAVLELVRNHFNEPVIVTSSYRCPAHNTAVGGVKNSQHLLGIAADIRVKGLPSLVVFEFLDSIFPHSYGMGLYEGQDEFVHIDVRDTKARWHG